MLTQDEQALVARKVRLMMRRDRVRLVRVAKGEMSEKSYRDLLSEDEEELRDLLKEVG